MAISASTLPIGAPLVAAAYSADASIGQRPGPAVSADALVSRLGSKTRISSGYLLEFDEALVSAISQKGQEAIEPLRSFLNPEQPKSRLALLEGIYTAQKLAEHNTVGVDTLYGTLSKYNTSPDPLVQVYLAGVYRALNEPATFGPMLSTLVYQSVYHYPQQAKPEQNVTEELGGTILQQIANRTAEETVKRLLPYLSAQTPPNQRFSAQG